MKINWRNKTSVFNALPNGRMFTFEGLLHVKRDSYTAFRYISDDSFVTLITFDAEALVSRINTITIEN